MNFSECQVCSGYTFFPWLLHIQTKRKQTDLSENGTCHDTETEAAHQTCCVIQSQWMDQPIWGLTLECQASCKVATTVQILKSLVWSLDLLLPNGAYHQATETVPSILIIITALKGATWDFYYVLMQKRWRGCLTTPCSRSSKTPQINRLKRKSLNNLIKEQQKEHADILTTNAHLCEKVNPNS